MSLRKDANTCKIECRDSFPIWHLVYDSPEYKERQKERWACEDDCEGKFYFLFYLFKAKYPKRKAKQTKS